MRRFAVARTSLILLAFILPAARTAASSPATNDSTDAKPAAMQTRLYFGMWSTHLRDLNHGLASNSMVGFAFRGVYGATFINSFGDRAVAGGLQRSFSPARVGNITTWLGYRVGLITGYDERLFGIGDKLPAVPFAQFTAGIDVRNFVHRARLCRRCRFRHDELSVLTASSSADLDDSTAAPSAATAVMPRPSSDTVSAGSRGRSFPGRGRVTPAAHASGRSGGARVPS